MWSRPSKGSCSTCAAWADGWHVLLKSADVSWAIIYLSSVVRIGARREGKTWPLGRTCRSRGNEGERKRITMDWRRSVRGTSLSAGEDDTRARG
jgi:hypothetical protein